MTLLPTLVYNYRMDRSVKISEARYNQIKAIAKAKAQFMTYHLNEAIRLYIEKLKKEGQA